METETVSTLKKYPNRLEMAPIGLLLLLGLNWLVAINPAHAQQNGEVTLPYSDKARQVDSRESAKPPLGSDQIRAVQYLDVNGLPVLVQFTYVGPPKILPIATADSYPEGSSVNLICTVSGGQRKGLTLAWTKDGQELDEKMAGYSSLADNVSIEKTGVDISILRISNATHTNSGRFSCTAKNPIGEDSTSVNIVINGWYLPRARENELKRFHPNLHST